MSDVRMKFFITGGAWITAAGSGTLGRGERVVFAPGRPQVPSAKEIFTERVARFGRYDDLTKLGCACVALALRDAGLDGAAERRPIGIVSASRLECLATDIDYFKTALEDGGALASPNLFSYTLPGIMLGECAVNFKLAGPTLCIGEDAAAAGRGRAALRCAAALLEAGPASAMLAGWIDCAADAGVADAGVADAGAAGELPTDLISGAVFVVLEAGPGAAGRARFELAPGGTWPSVTDIFEPCAGR